MSHPGEGATGGATEVASARASCRALSLGGMGRARVPEPWASWRGH